VGGEDLRWTLTALRTLNTLQLQRAKAFLVQKGGGALFSACICAHLRILRPKYTFLT
jgi:hypothetical protein